MKRLVTVAWLKERGITGDKYPEDYDHACIRHVECERGLAKVVFEDDGKNWRLKIEYHPEDWSGTNDLKEHRASRKMELVEVEAVQRTAWEEKR